MQLKIDKKLEAGSFKVSVIAVAFTPEESSKISKFGSPMISLAPKNYFDGRIFRTTIPVHILNHSFVFNNETEADQFVKDITERIKSEMETLRGKEDKFTDEKELNL